MKVSIVIRTYNEERHLPDVLEKIASQRADSLPKEVIIVDSGSKTAPGTLPKASGVGLCALARTTSPLGGL